MIQNRKEKAMDILKKFLSRKFLAAAAGTTIGAAVALLGLDQSIIASCFGAAMSCASVLMYIRTEGKIDAEAVKQAVSAVQNAVETIVDSDNDGTQKKLEQ